MSTILFAGHFSGKVVKHRSFCMKRKKSRRRVTGLRDKVYVAVFSLTAYFIASAVATATATVAPTMGLLPMPKKPIISTCAGTEEEPAN